MILLDTPLVTPDYTHVEVHSVEGFTQSKLLNYTLRYGRVIDGVVIFEKYVPAQFEGQDYIDVTGAPNIPDAILAKLGITGTEV